MKEKAVIFALLVSVVPSTAYASDDFLGVWEPYSEAGSWFGALTIEKDRIAYAAGPHAGLAPVRDGGSVFRLVDPVGEAFDDCGNAAANFIGFRVLGNGLLAALHYLTNEPPHEPEGRNALEIVQNNACSVAFFSRR